MRGRQGAGAPISGHFHYISLGLSQKSILKQILNSLILSTFESLRLSYFFSLSKGEMVYNGLPVVDWQSVFGLGGFSLQVLVGR